jgi:hypothetical protein
MIERASEPALLPSHFDVHHGFAIALDEAREVRQPTAQIGWTGPRFQAPSTALDEASVNPYMARVSAAACRRGGS